MKKSWLLGIFWILVIAASVISLLLSRYNHKSIESARPSIPESIKHLRLKQARQQNVTIAQLSGASQIDGFSCAAGWIHFNESGQLQAFFHAEAGMIQGNQIPKGTWVQLDEGLNLKFCSFPENTNIQGYLCKGGFGGAEGVSTAFYPSGRLKGFYTPNDIVVQGIPCKASVFSPIYLYENGSLKDCTLFRDTRIDGRRVPEGNRIILSETGAIKSVNIPNNTLLKRAQKWVMKLLD